MAEFKMVYMRLSEREFHKFEDAVNELVKEGWHVINCNTDAARFFAFLTRES
jgi:hypothetical protein